MKLYIFFMMLLAFSIQNSMLDAKRIQISVGKAYRSGSASKSSPVKIIKRSKDLFNSVAEYLNKFEKYSELLILTAILLSYSRRNRKICKRVRAGILFLVTFLKSLSIYQDLKETSRVGLGKLLGCALCGIAAYLDGKRLIR